MADPDELDQIDEGDEEDEQPAAQRVYITRAGADRLHKELLNLLNVERPKVTAEVSAAAAQGDRSENAEYIYGKKRLREIDSRIRFLTKRLEVAEIVDPQRQKNRDQVFFGATVTYADRDGTEKTVTIVGIDEADLDQGQVSWVSPIARALMKAHEGDVVELRTPSGIEPIEIIEIRYRDDALG
jgi:transcription elongation factor GreB